MQAFADRFPGWKDFPKGLRVMVVDEDPHVLLDVQRKLEACGYAASAFSGEEEALQALGNGAGEFHVAVVEATSSTTLDGFKIMAAAKHLPTIMMANTENMGIMMQGIAAGASEFLQKPLSEDKLKNIWQHVVKKALSSGCALPLPKQSSGGGGEVKAVPAPPEQRNAEPGMDPQEGGAGGVQSLLGLDQKPDVELLCYTPPQLEQSAACRVAHTEDDAADVSAPYPHRCLAASCAALDHAADVDDNFDDCEDFFHIRSDVANAVNNSSVLNELFDSKPSSLDPATHDHDHHHYHHALLLDQDHGHGIHDFHKLDPRLGDELDFDSSMHHSFEDIGLSSDLMEGDMLSLSDGGSFLHDSHQAHSFQEEASLLDCLDADDDGCDILQEIDEEALLLAEVAKAERGIAGSSSSNQSFNHQLPSTYGNTSEFSPRSSSRSDSEHSGCKGSKVANGKKKMKVDWTPELHRRFVQAVEQLGVDKAIPSRILEIMGVKCLTRHNIASHLQKFRSHRKHLRAREAEAASWNTHHRKQPRCTNPPATSSSSCVTSAWAVPRLPPPIHPRPSQLHVWGHPTTAPVDMHFWPAAWPACHVDSWAPAAGTPFYAAQPMLRLPLAPVPTSVANVVVPIPSPRPFPYGESSTKQLCNVHPPKETVDAAINEVLRNPFIPLPLGLKAPSLESVISELQRQGITMATSSS